MKGIIKNIVSVLMCLMFVLTSCTDNIVPNSLPQDDGEKIPIALDLTGLFGAGAQTRSLVFPGDTVAGSLLEDMVTDVTAYIFDNYYQCEEIIQEVVPPIVTPVGPVMVSVGTKHIVVVLNGIGKLNLETNPSAVSYSALLEQLTLDLGTLPESAFLMTGLKNDVVLPTQVPITAPHVIQVEVKRACAKVKFSIGLSDKAAGRSIDLTEITMYQGARRVPIFRAPAGNPTVYNLTKTITLPPLFDVPDLIPAGGGSFTGYKEVPDSLYTYESLCGRDTTKAVRMEVKWDMSGIIRTAKFFLALDNSSGDSVYNVRRNTWYNVKMNIVDPGSDSIYVSVTACPWNVADTITPAPIGEGAEFNTALPFKLVKNLTNAEMSLTNTAGRSYAAIESHSRGASWIDFKVTHGTPWEFNVRDNTSRNQGVYYSLDSATWTLFPVSGTLGASGTGDDDWHRIYIYRPYRENNEPPLGPTLKATLSGIHKQDFTIEPRDTLPIPTNCFILRPELSAPVNQTRVYIPLSSVFSHWENEIALGNVFRSYLPITADVLWKDHPTGQVVKNVSVINASSPDEAYIYAEAGVPGSAVIAMRLTTPPLAPDIYWTFHVWVTEYNPYEAAGQKFYQTSGTDIVKNVFMDRDLGAMDNTWDADGNARGLYYQYGRKDPFPRGELWANSPWKWFNPANVRQPVSTQTATLTPVSPDFRPRNALVTVLHQPNVFITRTGGEDWTIYQENPNLWITPGGNKTAYDPCPEGWRIPDMPQNILGNFPWDGALLSNVYDPNQFNSSIASGWYSPAVGYYPKGGYISASGVLGNSGTHARFWTSYSVSTNMAIGLQFDDIAPPAMGTVIDKAWGVSVRCVVDKNYILNVENGGLFGTGIINLKNVLLP